MLIFALAALVALLWSLWLWFMIYRAEQWSRFVDWENAMFSRTGLIPESIICWFKTRETGLTIKVVVSLTIFSGLGSVAVILLCYP